MFKASHVMTRSLITLSPDMSAADAIRTLLQHQISGAPVVDSTDQLVGIISEYKLLCVIIDEETAQTPVGELMTKDVITIKERTPLSDVAHTFMYLRIRRLPVLNEGKLVGQVSRRDVLRCIINETGSDDLLRLRDELVHREVSAHEEPQAAHADSSWVARIAAMRPTLRRYM